MDVINTTTGIKDSIATQLRVYSDKEIRKKVEDAEKAVSWFQSQMDRGSKGVFSETVTITPSMAECFRHRNVDNRNINKNRLAEIKADLANGRWTFNGESIVISRDGYLNDGQHRVQAVIETGVPMKSIVVWGVERSTRATVDQGTSRKAADFLMMKGATGASLQAVTAVARMMLIYEKSRGQRATATWANKNFAPTKTEVAQFAFDNLDEIRRSLVQGGNVKIFGHAAIVSFCKFVLCRRNPSLAPQFIEKVSKGANLSESDPVYSIRVRLIAERLSTAERIELVFRTWNIVRSKSAQKRVRLTGTLPELAA